jgi:hypothetical protein
MKTFEAHAKKIVLYITCGWDYLNPTAELVIKEEV